MESVRPPIQHAPREVAILVVNGFDRRGRWGPYNADEAIDYPWIDLCLSQVTRYSSGVDYEVLVWDNTGLALHEQLALGYPRVKYFRASDEGPELRHGQALERLRKEVSPSTEYIVTIDTDSFPIRAGWLDNLVGRLSGETLLAGVWRDEMLPLRPAFVHPSCLAIRQSKLIELGTGFTIGQGVDVGSRVSSEVLKAGKQISRLRRSNVWQPHFLMGGVYADLVYHQGAGSRSPKFATSSATADEQIRQTLRDLAFSDLDTLIAVLSGNLGVDQVGPLANLAVE